MPFSFNPLSSLGLDQSIPLDSAGKIPSGYLPSYVDDVEEYADLASFPATGETGKIYVAIDTGFTYRWSGSVYIQINSLTGTFAADSGTEGAPSVSIGTADNGLYAPGTDQVAISTNGTGRLFVTSDGKINIGSVARIEDTGEVKAVNGTESAPSFSFLNDPDNGMWRPTTNTLGFSTAGTEHARITSDGKLGLGTSTAYAKLQVNGDIRCSFVGDGSDFIGWGSGGGTAKYAYISATNEGSQDVGLSFNVTTNAGSSNIEAIRIDDLGNVGIGTTSPSSTLSVRQAAADFGVARITRPDSDTGCLYLGNDSNNNALISSNNTALRFGKAVVNTFNEYARIDSSGRLLVGTSSESGGSLLQVNDDRIRIASSKTPASASDTGTAGEICWDSSYIYVCTATNTWKRAALSTW